MIYTYCRTNNPHEKYYFAHPDEMVAGKVKPSRMDLLNEELFSNHLHALVLTKRPIPQLAISISDVVDYEDLEAMPIRDTVKDLLTLEQSFKDGLKVLFTKLMSDTYLKGKLEEQRPYWFNDEWIEKKLNDYMSDFDAALERWRILYRSAQMQIYAATEIINNRAYGDNSVEKRKAHNDLRWAEALRDKLLGVEHGGRKEDDEFYPYPSAIKAIKEAADAVGMEKLMWGSDYPRTITAITYKMSYDFVTKSKELTDKEKQQFLCDNARRFFGFGELKDLPYIKNMSE